MAPLDRANTLVEMSPALRLSVLASMSPDERTSLAADRVFVRHLRVLLQNSRAFGDVAALLMIRVPPGVRQPVQAGFRLWELFTTALGDPAVTERLLSRGYEVFVIPELYASSNLAGGDAANARHQRPGGGA